MRGETVRKSQWVVRLAMCGLAVACAGLVVAETPPQYEVVEIGGFAGPSGTYAIDLNEDGVVVGRSFVSLSELEVVGRPFMWRSGGMTELDLEPGLPGAATGVNDRGQVVGFIDDPEDGYQVFVMQAGGVFDYPFLDGTIETGDINDSGWIIGHVFPQSGGRYPFLFDGQQVIDLTPTGATEGTVTALNDAGVAVGWYNEAGCGRHGFIWNGGQETDIDLDGCEDIIQPEAINDSGQVVGSLQRETSADYVAFLYDDGALYDLPTLGGSTAWASGISDRGWIVGQAINADGRFRAFLHVDGTSYDCNDLIPEDSPWELRWASAVNNRGQVLAYGRDAEANSAGWVLLEPVVPQTVEELIEELIDDVGDLIDDGELNRGRGRSLIAELQVALWFLEYHNGESIAAVRLEIFIKKVEQFIAIGDLDPDLGGELLVKARAALEMLRSGG